MTVDAVGGTWTYALDLAAGLSARDVEVTLAILGPPPAKRQHFPGVTVIDTGLPLDWLASDEQELRRGASKLAALARQADIVHLNSPCLAAFGDFVQPIVGVCHSCLQTWWDAVRGGPLPEDFTWRGDVLARGYAACDDLVAPTASFAAATVARYGVRPRVVYNGRSWPSARAASRKRFVLTAGRLWDDGKNIADLEDAADLIDAPILAAGPLAGPVGGDRVLRGVQALGALDGSELQSWMRQAPIFASMALYEPFGLAVLEAAQAGCALVLSDIPTFRELWEGVAIFVPPHQPKILAASLQELLHAPLIAAERGAAARSHAARYSPDAMTRAMLDLYRAHAGAPTTA